MKTILGEYGTITGPERMSDADCAKKGLPKGSAKLTVGDGGSGSKVDVAVYYDAQSDRFYKEMNDPTDGKNTPIVRMTDDERKALEKNWFMQNREHNVTDSSTAEYQMLRSLGLAGH